MGWKRGAKDAGGGGGRYVGVVSDFIPTLVVALVVYGYYLILLV